MSGGTACGDEPGLQSLQQVESGKGHRRREPGAIGDELSEGWWSSVCRRRWWLVGAMEQVVDVSSTRCHAMASRMPGQGTLA